ncbi:addiction module antidote protein, HigA family [Persephonella hydrogeniphila]|uniref:Addiction module antidote protein, HigA family n=1 Tax=Persephonella hydrogeniphila TaxID=198703 RepID=A0A285NH54_9AQUI|nr:HigA family addiction module antitoxin [Persephonella hydrogeniphila]SNZ06981.1 addiction module antidote protein, HigA family [Persephonella hydrogeniphila]
MSTTIKKTYKAPTILELEREPTHPGEILLEEFLEPLGITQTQLAKELGVSFRAINEIVNKKRGISPEMAIKLSERFGVSPEFWLGLQLDYDLWKSYQKMKKRE